MTPSRTQELAVLRSVTYAAMFEYPLSLEQLHASLIGVRADAATVAAWWRNSELLQATIDHQEGLYFPAGRADLLHTRARREALSCDLLARDRRILSVVAAMPFVRMVALSGSLAHLNAERSADLDLFVITAPHRVWSVTLSLLVIARLFGWRRRMCLNYVISEDALRVEPPDLFSANQIIHLRPILGHDVFARFVAANAFVREHYPNFSMAGDPLGVSSPHALKPSGPPRALKTLLERVMSFGAAQLGERAARAIYGWHLNRRAATWQSRDQVRLDAECLKLHTSSHRAAALARYDAAVTEALRRAADKATLAS
jgi:hypothetical protein